MTEDVGVDQIDVIAEKAKRSLGRVSSPHVCGDWSEAFDISREVGAPTVCRVGNEVGRCFPSGRYESIGSPPAHDDPYESAHEF